MSNEELLTSEETMETDRPDLKNFKTEKGLHFIHLNVRSLLPKIDQIRHYVEDTKCSIIGVTETWLDSTVPDAELNIPGYTVIRKDRNRQGGGVCIFVENAITFNIRHDIQNSNCESVFREFSLIFYFQKQNQFWWEFVTDLQMKAITLIL